MNIKDISRDTQEMPQSRSTGLPRRQKKRDEEQMTKQTPLLKPQPRKKTNKKKLHQGNRLGSVNRQTTCWAGVGWLGGGGGGEGEET